MATKYISDLTAVTSILDSDVLVIDDGAHNYKISWGALKALMATVSSMTADETGEIVITLANGETVSCTPHDPKKQDKLTFDDTPTANSANPVTSKGIKTALDEKMDCNKYTLFTGASKEKPGTSGIVPAPAADGKYLSSGGAWETPDSAPTEGSDKLITSGAVKAAMDNVKIAVDSDMSDSSTNPVQNKVITGKLKSTSRADKAYHLGFYIDADGDLCYDYD